MILLGRRYLLREVLGAGAMGIVYRATDRLNGQSVALKLVTSPDQALQFETATDDANLRLALAHEFGLLASLRHPNIISVLDYGFDAHRQPYFTMEYLEQAANVRDVGYKASLPLKISLLFQVLQALAYLHRRGIVHRDLKSANVLVVNEQVKVLDFGLAARRDERDETVGTLAYMAPELLEGAQASVSSDLYAVGVIAYELFAGGLPFWSESFSQIIDDIRTKTPDLKLLDAEPALIHVVERLLAKKPTDRYSSALDAIDALSAAAGQAHPVETEAIRDSFLQAAQFVGRDSELALLTEVMDRVASRREPAGAIWLVGGESGVGKSRLLDEVRVQALVHGALVLRGQALDAGGDVYQVWRAVLRWLVVLVDLTELEASVLGLLVSDISTLLGYAVRPAPELNPDATQTRLFKVIEDVMTRYVHGGAGGAGPVDGGLQPLVIILEDLQWAGESLALLNSLSQAASQLPLLIIGSYRSEEAADLPGHVPNAKLMLLHRLAETSIADLSASMLGESGRNPALVALLERETEGNVFFMIQILRTLAEETGQLDQIGSRALPATVAAGGLQRAVQRRLERVPPSARPLLQMAAVAGRELDLPLLRAMLASGAVGKETDLGLWLLVCANVNVIEVREERWRFSHDKLREAVLADLSTDSRRALHRSVAQALEQTDPQAVGRLAYHWQMAGDEAKERQYAILAGRQASVHGAYHQAVAYLERALSIVLPSEAANTEEAALALASLTHSLAYAYLGLDHTLQTRKYSAQGVAQLGYPMPEGRPQMLLALAGAMLRQGWHRLHPRRYGPDLPADIPLNARRNRQLQVAKIYQLHWVASFFLNDSLNGILASLLSLNLAEQAGVKSQFGSTYAGAALATSLLLPPRVSTFYVRMALKMAEHTEDANGSADALHISGLVSAGRADWATAEKALNQSIDLHLRIGDLVRWQYSLNILVEIAYYQAQYDRSLELNEESFATSLKYDFGQVQTWGLRRRAMNLFRQGQVETAAHDLAESLPYYSRHTDTLNETNAYGLLASVRLRQGDRAAAQDAADSAAALVGNSAPLGYYLMDGYVGIAEVRFARWRAEPDNPVLRKAAWQACENLQRYGRIFPVGRARAALFLGRYYAIQGKIRSAQATWQISRNTAQKLAMPYEEALALYELGCSQANDAVNREQLLQSIAIFERIGTPYELELAGKALREVTPDVPQTR